MKSKDMHFAEVRCETCDEVINLGKRALSLEDSVIGRNGFIPLLDDQNLHLFCREDHLLDFSILEDLRIHQTDRNFDPGKDCEGEPSERCLSCHARLEYGTRALRWMEGEVDGIGFNPALEANLFCSKRCLDESVTSATELSLSEFWEDVKRNIDRDSNRKLLN